MMRSRSMIVGLDVVIVDGVLDIWGLLGTAAVEAIVNMCVREKGAERWLW